MRNRLLRLVALLAFACALKPAHSALAVQFLNEGGGSNTPNTMGWVFHVLNPITIDQLGFYDHGRDGLLGDHQVGIFDPAGNLLVSATVPQGTGAELVQDFRMVDIDPITLPAAQQYRIVGTNNRDAVDTIRMQVADILFYPSIVYGGSRQGSDLFTLSDIGPGIPIGGTGTALWQFSANFSIVPSPATLLLLGIGLAGLAAAMRRTGY